ncbi:hypothetical protein BDV95DRAFT_349219 [Massariosphaeria phaeospora]|uniref:Uncharacterized protein n=1 Tax=Massariosphaeria phaeospora TaxID=100035 RepID=A0A7C8ICE2_9PLEO|nr:hypothetical protein BDV95DRAFT_349219 [Massariosphaeria phaeospora]
MAWRIGEINTRFVVSKGLTTKESKRIMRGNIRSILPYQIGLSLLCLTSLRVPVFACPSSALSNPTGTTTVSAFLFMEIPFVLPFAETGLKVEPSSIILRYLSLFALRSIKPIEKASMRRHIVAASMPAIAIGVNPFSDDGFEVVVDVYEARVVVGVAELRELGEDGGRCDATCEAILHCVSKRFFVWRNAN